LPRPILPETVQTIREATNDEIQALVAVVDGSGRLGADDAPTGFNRIATFDIVGSEDE